MFLSRLCERFFLWLRIIHPISLFLSRSCKFQKRNETKRLSSYAFNHCFSAGKKKLKQIDKNANSPDANLLYASQNVRKIVHKITRIEKIKQRIKMTSCDWPRILLSLHQTLRPNGGGSWLFSSKTSQLVLPWENLQIGVRSQIVDLASGNWYCGNHSNESILRRSL